MSYSMTLDYAAHWAAVILYVAATVAVVFGILFERPRAERLGFGIAQSGALVHGAVLVYRWIASGHGPYIVRYEVLSADAWVAIVTFLLAARFFPQIRRAAMLVFPATFLTIAAALFFNPQVRKLPPSLRSIWLVLHIGFYKIALATALIALALSILYLVKKAGHAAWTEALPPEEAMDLYAYRFAGFAFTFWAIGMLAGSIWAYYSWGNFWGWDPVETWSLITWFAFGIYLHLRRFFGWKGSRAAYLYIVCFALAVFTIFFTSLAELSLHRQYFT